MTEPTDKELEAFAIEEQFLLFCDVDEFTQIARAVLAKWGTPPAVAETLTKEQIDSLLYKHGYDPDDEHMAEMLQAAVSLKRTPHAG